MSGKGHSLGVAPLTPLLRRGSLSRAIREERLRHAFTHSGANTDGEYTAITPSGSPVYSTAPEDYFSSFKGAKHYELKNHLGNVLATVSDKRDVEVDGSNNVQNYTAKISDVSFYYPFGSLMPGLSDFGGEHRYGFGGHEKDNEVKQVAGAWYGFGDYGYDSRIIRRPSPDPLTEKFPGISPYAAFANNPIYFSDKDGHAVTPETVWDVFNVAMGVVSLAGNAASGNVLGAAVDGVGLLYDGVATLVPVLPAGASASLGVYRFTKLTTKAVNSIDVARQAISGKGGAFKDLAIALDKTENAITKNGKLDDVFGAIKEKLGVPLESPKIGGHPEGHVQEVQGVANRLGNTMEQIDEILRRGKDLSKKEASILKETHSKLSELKGKYESFLETAGKFTKESN